MEESKELVEIKTLLNELSRKWEDTLAGKFTKEEFTEFEKKINDRIDKLETEMRRPLLRVEERKDEKSPEMKAFSSWLRKETKDLTPEELKVLTLSPDTAGGYLAPSEYVREIIKGIVEFSPVRELARVRPTSARSVQVPKRTGTFAGAWTAEIGTRTETTGLTYGLEEIPTHEMYADVRISLQDLEDSAFNMESEIASEISEQLGVLEGTAFISGNAVGKPEGLLTRSGITEVVSGSASAITADGLINLFYELKDVYAKNASFLMKRTTVRDIRKLKDSYGQFLWQPGLQSDQPATLLGRPIYEAVDMPVIATNAYPVLFGDFKRGYLIVDRIQISIQKLIEKYADVGQIGFLARKRVGGQVVLTEAIVKLKIST